MSTPLGIVSAVKARSDRWRCALEGFASMPQTQGRLQAYYATREGGTPDAHDFYQMSFYARHPEFSPRRCNGEVR